MKLYDLDTVLTFGRHKGFSVTEVLKQDPTYSEWAYGVLRDFFITDAVWEVLKMHKKSKPLAYNQRKHEEKKRNYKNYRIEHYSKKLDLELSGHKNSRTAIGI